jgi:hypothetical protein
MGYIGYYIFCRAVKQAGLMKVRSFEESQKASGRLQSKLWKSAPLTVRSYFRRLAQVAEPHVRESAKHSLRLGTQRKAMASRATYNLVMKWIYACPELRNNFSPSDLTRIAAATTKKLSAAERQRVRLATKAAQSGGDASKYSYEGNEADLKKIDPDSFFAQLVSTPEVKKYSTAFQAFVAFKCHNQPSAKRADVIERCKELWETTKFEVFNHNFDDLKLFENFCLRMICTYPSLHFLVCDPARRVKLGESLVAAFLKRHSRSANLYSNFGEKLPLEDSKAMQAMSTPTEGEPTVSFTVKAIKAFIQGDANLKGEAKYRTCSNWKVKGTAIPPSTYGIASDLNAQQVLHLLQRGKQALPKEGSNFNTYQWAVLATNHQRSDANSRLLAQTYREFRNTAAIKRLARTLGEVDGVEGAKEGGKKSGK